jgi:predicted nucleic acid-binding protein
VKTFLDSGVLLCAWKGRPEDSDAAMFVIHDARRQFVTSRMVKMELLPKPTFFGHHKELEFYQTHFETVDEEQLLTEEISEAAFALAKQNGLAAADAINLACALKLKANEFVTTEKPGKPIFRVRGIKIITLHAAAAQK